MDDQPGTILITHNLKEHDNIIAYAKRHDWLLVGLVKHKTTYLTPTGQLVQIQIEIEKD